MENDGTKSSMCVNKIWERCSQVRPNALAESEQIEEVEMESEGVCRFKRNPTKMVNFYNSIGECEDFNRHSILPLAEPLNLHGFPRGH